MGKITAWLATLIGLLLIVALILPLLGVDIAGELIGGIFMFLVGFFPCDPQCIDVTLTGRLHSFTATVPAISIPLAAMVSAYPISKNWNKNWGYLSFILGILSIAAGPLMFLEVMDNFTGLIQRLGTGISLLWIFILSIKIYKEI